LQQFCELAQMSPATESDIPDDFTTLEAARLLGMSVRSVQLMVDRGELEAWKTPGGHRRIARASIERWRSSRGAARSAAEAPAVEPVARGTPASPPRVLLIDDSIHFQKLVSLLASTCRSPTTASPAWRCTGVSSRRC